MNKAYIALGSNIYPRLNHLNRAVDSLETNLSITVNQKSSIYEREPVGYMDQKNFLNMVLEVSTSLTPLELLHYCQSIEQKLGRKRDVRWGPRTIDLDILLYNQENIMSEQLTVPHPRMHERAFVLVPLCEINSSSIIPTMNKSVREILGQLPQHEKKGVKEWAPANGEEE